MALGARPSNVCTTFDILATMFDEVWHIVGDNSTNVDWYAKRAMLGAVYTATGFVCIMISLQFSSQQLFFLTCMRIFFAAELYMLTDRSHGYSDTWSFLDRRLEEAVQFSTLPSEGSALLSKGLQFAWSSFSHLMKPPGQR